MAYCELTQPLLESLDDSYEDTGFDNKVLVEDSSSGYDSNDVSDTESECSIESRATLKAPATTKHQDVVARIKSTNTLCASLKLILDMPELCDVTFLVGAEQIPIHGVRAILGTRSKVFYQLIMRHLREESSKPSKLFSQYGHRLTIPVKKYDTDVFRTLIQFIHSGSASLNDRNVVGLLCGADQFELRDLEQACWKYIDGRIEQGYGSRILHSTRFYNHHKKTVHIYNEIYSLMSEYHVGTTSSSTESTV
ncbi:hypothetical protein ACF0H5_018076 [Mactra antiquata]